MLTSFATKNSGYTYYQGYNYIGEIFLMTYGKQIGYVFIERLAWLFFKEYFMEETFKTKITDRLRSIFNIMTDFYPNALRILRVEESDDDSLVGKFAFMLSWLLCWYSYKISDVNIIMRIFDYLICNDDCAIE